MGVESGQWGLAGGTAFRQKLGFIVKCSRSLGDRMSPARIAAGVGQRVLRARGPCSRLSSPGGWLLAGLMFALGTAWVASLASGQDVRGGSGFRTVKGRHLTLATDLPSSTAIDDLPQAFDLAVPQWCAYFQVPPEQVASWHVRGYLMVDDRRFRQAGLLPEDLPPFLHGYQKRDQFWVREQPSAYYRRHLVLHEGTHAFMSKFLPGGARPGWYSEGMAELLGTHRFERGELQLRVVPGDKTQVPQWGRIKLIQEAVANGHPRALPDVIQLTQRDFQGVEAYAWSWAATAFLEGHPQWQSALRQLAHAPAMSLGQFNAKAWRELGFETELSREAWQVFLHNLDYGYCVAADEIMQRPTAACRATSWVQVDAARGWQSSGLELEAGRSYELTASGRVQLNQEAKPWFAEPGGITIRYHQGRPLGMLLGAVRPQPLGDEPTPLVSPQPIGIRAVLRPSRDGVLYLAVNEAAGGRADNRGQMRVRVSPLPDQFHDATGATD